MSGYRFVGLDSHYTQTLRTRRRDAFGQPIEVFPTEDPEMPCRHCLNEIGLEKEVLVLSHRPFPQPGPYSEVGPIFICDSVCTRFETAEEIPPVIATRKVVLRGYTARDRINYGSAELVEGRGAAPVIRRLLADPENAYLHVRTALNGCFLARVERT